MTESQQTDQSQHDQQGTRHTVVVPGSIDMVRLLGPGNDLLGLVTQLGATVVAPEGGV